MSHITAILVVLILTGSPVTSTVCAMVCGHPPTPAAHCHEGPQTSANLAVTGDIACGSVVPDAPYVRENGPSAQPAALTPVQHAASPRPVTLSRHQTINSAAGAWLVPPLVLRL